MSRSIRALTAAAAASVALAALMAPTVASATPAHASSDKSPAHVLPPGKGVTDTTMAQWTSGSTTYVLREITIPPGGSTGWHSHQADLYGFIRQGTLTHTGTDCTVVAQEHQGATFQAPGGTTIADDRNVGNKPLIFDDLYVVPQGEQINIAAPDPGCKF